MSFRRVVLKCLHFSGWNHVVLARLNSLDYLQSLLEKKEEKNYILKTEGQEFPFPSKKSVFSILHTWLETTPLCQQQIDKAETNYVHEKI